VQLFNARTKIYPLARTCEQNEIVNITLPNLCPSRYRQGAFISYLSLTDGNSTQVLYDPAQCDMDIVEEVPAQSQEAVLSLSTSFLAFLMRCRVCLL
jgi:hypothetical protein